MWLTHIYIERYKSTHACTHIHIHRHGEYNIGTRADCVNVAAGGQHKLLHNAAWDHDTPSFVFCTNTPSSTVPAYVSCSLSLSHFLCLLFSFFLVLYGNVAVFLALSLAVKLHKCGQLLIIFWDYFRLPYCFNVCICVCVGVGVWPT